MVLERRVPLASAIDPKSAHLCSFVGFGVGSYTDFEMSIFRSSIDTSSVYRSFEIRSYQVLIQLRSDASSRLTHAVFRSDNSAYFVLRCCVTRFP